MILKIVREDVTEYLEFDAVTFTNTPRTDVAESGVRADYWRNGEYVGCAIFKRAFLMENGKTVDTIREQPIPVQSGPAEKITVG